MDKLQRRCIWQAVGARNWITSECSVEGGIMEITGENIRVDVYRTKWSINHRRRLELLNAKIGNLQSSLSGK